MDVYLIDGTYELFRHYFAVPAAADVNGQEIGAVRGVLNSVLSMMLEAMGVLVWPMVYFEADDALASAAAKAALDDRVGQVLICTPDKDLGQCVVGTRVVQLDRRQNLFRDEASVVAKFGVKPESIPDYLAVVGDSADGFPGVRGWGAKAASSVLSQYVHVEGIPKDWMKWHPSIRKARVLSESLFAAWDDALLFRILATLRLDVPVFETVEELRWKGPRKSFEGYCGNMNAAGLLKRVASAGSKSLLT